MTAAPRACVIGWPIKHSRSPLIHGHWLQVHGLAGSYTKEAVEPERFEAFVRSMPEQGFVGGNVTVPHKEALYAMADRRDMAAEAIGAANTLWFEDGVLSITNTDAHGFMTNLDRGADGWDRSEGPAVVLGAGGAARAILYGLIERDISIRLLNRTASRAEELAEAFGASVTVLPWEDRHDALSGARLLVNTTTLGMEGAPALDLHLEDLPAAAAVTDIVYAPLMTDLLLRAKRRGNRTVDGLGMLLHQAVPGFEKWFGVCPEVTPALRDLVIRDLDPC